MDHWEERAKQPGVAGVAKYMAAFIRFLKIFGNKSCINICRKKLGLHWVKDSEVQRAVGRLSKIYYFHHKGTQGVSKKVAQNSESYVTSPPRSH